MACDPLEQLRQRLGAPEDVADGDFSFGIEEEYFLVNARTGRVVEHSPEALFEEAFAAADGRIGREFLQAQIEAATLPCVSAPRARAELCFVRALLGLVAAKRGLAILACGTHPTAVWRQSVQSAKPRYDAIMAELGIIGRRNMFCGMHVHVELPDPARRVDVMGRMLPYVPLFLALSTSSPFWQGQATGLASYRGAAYEELPRSGLPDLFSSEAEYQACVAALVQAGAIKDASHIWWSIRPSARYPTLELRAPDCCPRVDDAVAIASLYRALAHHLYFHPEHNAGMGAMGRTIAVENKWRAQRYGIHCAFVTEAGAVSVADFLDEVVDMTAKDADMLDCGRQVARCRALVSEGTAADFQQEIFNRHVARRGAGAALAEVIGWIGATTME